MTYFNTTLHGATPLVWCAIDAIFSFRDELIKLGLLKDDPQIYDAISNTIELAQMASYLTPEDKEHLERVIK
jgi:hypothetical protein